MPERRRIPEDNPAKPNKPVDDGNQPTQPFLPPELPDDDATRLQTTQDQTRYMPPVKDTRLIPPTPQSIPPEKLKRDTGVIVPSRPSQPVPYNAGNEVSKPKRGQPPAYPIQRRDVRSERRNSPLRLPIWSVLLMLMLVVGATACVVVAILGLGGRNAATAPPQFVVISAVPSNMPAVTIPSLLATPTLPAEFQQTDAGNFVLAGPTLAPIIYTATPTLAPQITIGSTIEIIGNQGINIRNNPGTDNGVVTVANPGEQYTVLAGPQQSNGLNWWQISDPARGITGWAADNDGTTDLFQVVTP
ncbi:MAG: SH3 domain-containing protein [Anaerolineae bacterium]|nr:SH3 domain-containing protein [Anaerolineae bacterium]